VREAYVRLKAADTCPKCLNWLEGAKKRKNSAHEEKELSMSKLQPKVVQGARKYQQHGLAKAKAIAYAKRGIRRAARRSQSKRMHGLPFSIHATQAD
jgi:hypothetical protein